MATSKAEIVLSSVAQKAELFRQAADASHGLKSGMDRAYAEFIKITNPDQKSLLTKGFGLFKRVFSNSAEAYGNGDDIFGDLHANVLRMGNILQKLMPFLEEEVAIKEQLETLSKEVEEATTDEDRERTLNAIMDLISAKSEEVLGPNPFNRGESSLAPADLERQWKQVQQIIPVVSAGLDVQIATAMVFRDIYDQVYRLYWLLMEARNNALVAKQMAGLAETTAGLQIAGYEQAVLYINEAIATAENTMALGEQLGHMLETPHPALGELNGVLLEEAQAKAANIRNVYTQRQIK